MGQVMKAWQDCLKISQLEQECRKHLSDLEYIRSILPKYTDDIKQVRFEKKEKILIVCVEPWVWTWEVQEALHSLKKVIENAWQVNICHIKVRFLLS